MATRYQIRLLNQAGAQVSLLVEWRSLEYTKRVNRVGSYILTLDGDLPVVDDFVLDGYVEILRRDIDASPSFGWTLDFEALQRTQQRATASNGLSTFLSSGEGYNSILARRRILFRASTTGADKSGAGETVMKSYVNQNAGPGSIAPRLFNGVTPGFTIQADGGAGATWEGSRPFRPLMGVLREIADATSVDFQVVGTGPATFEFQAQVKPIGIDRTNVGIDPATGLNAAGNAPVIFSLDLGNMQTPSYSLVRGAEVTAAIVLGQGVENAREVIERTSAAITDSPLNRIESVSNANEENTTAGLNSVGDALLEKLQAKEDFDFQTLQIPGLLYGRDYFLGDLVTARYKTIERQKQIIGVTINVTEGVETITIELGDTT